MAHPSHLVVGYLNKPHGIKGEMYVSPLTDHPESVFASGVVLSLGGKDDDEPDPDLPPLRVDSTRPFRQGLLVHFGGVDDRSQAELLVGRYLFRAIDDLEPLAEGAVYYHQLLGLEGDGAVPAGDRRRGRSGGGAAGHRSAGGAPRPG